MRGFTLIELTVVIALIMILSAVGLGSYSQSSIKSKDTQRKNDINQLAKAVESFSGDVGRYPLSLDGEDFLHCYLKTDGVVSNPTCDNDKLYVQIDGAKTDYINIPEDPEPTQKYVYLSLDGSEFSFFAALENMSDRALLRDVNGSVISDPWGINCGSEPCNYKVTETGLVKSL